MIDNVELTEPMPLSISSVRWLIDQCPKLTVLGNLRTWSDIDYYDNHSPHFYRSESQLSQLKKEIVANNWDLDLEMENLDQLYSSS